MAEPGLEEAKDSLIQSITDVYARGDMDMPAFERAVTRIHASGDRQVLAVEAEALGLALPVPVPEPQRRSAPPALASPCVELSCVSGNIRKAGDWVRSRAYKLELKSSNARLDLMEYEGSRGFRLAIEVDALSSSLRLTVPKGFEVEERFSESRSSVVRNKAKDGSFGDNLIVLMGYLRSSTVKIKYR
jgi:hypothetical protein